MRHFFERLRLGYKGKKVRPSIYKCNLDYCNEQRSQYKGIGASLCEHHQSLLREYGGPARVDRPWTFHKKKSCDCCGFTPWEHTKVAMIEDELIRDRTAWGMLIVDHIHTQRDGGCDSPENTQTLCLNCNQIKSTLAGDLIPNKLYKNKEDITRIKEHLAPHYDKVFG